MILIVVIVDATLEHAKSSYDLTDYILYCVCHVSEFS